MLPIELWYLASRDPRQAPLDLRTDVPESGTAAQSAPPARPAYRPRRALGLLLIRLGRFVSGRRRRSALAYATSDR